MKNPLNLKNLKIIIFALSLVFVLSGCKNKSSKDSDDSSSSCLTQFENHLNMMLTKADISAHIQKDISLAEVDYDSTSSSKYQSYIFMWDGDADRKERVSFHGKDFGPKPYKVGVKGFYFIDDEVEDPSARFHQRHHNITAAEKEKLRKAMAKEIDKQDASDRVKKLSKNMSKSFTEHISFSKVEGVGDAAVWDHLDGCLTVLDGRAVFDVVVNMSDDHKEDVKLAKTLAKLILNKCE